MYSTRTPKSARVERYEARDGKTGSPSLGLVDAIQPYLAHIEAPGIPPRTLE
jgi:hypothetical protein